MIDQDYEQFIKNIKSKTGIDLSLYKEAQMKKKRKKRMKKKKWTKRKRTPLMNFTNHLQL